MLTNKLKKKESEDITSGNRAVSRKKFGGGFGKAPRTSRRRRRDRDAEGVEEVGNGDGVSPSPAD